MGSNVSACWQIFKKGAFFANPCFTQIHPTCIPVHGDYQSKLTLMSESLRNDGRIWVPKKKEDAEKAPERTDQGQRYFGRREGLLPGTAGTRPMETLVPRDVASRAAKERCDAGFGVGPTGLAVFLDFEGAIKRLGKHVIEERYGNLFQMYEKIVDENPYENPMMIYPAVHYTMGGIWVDYELMTTIPGLYALGEANFSDHGANRLGASALMQGLADGYFVLPYTIQNYLAGEIRVPRMNTDSPAFEEAEKKVRGRLEKLAAVKGSKSVDHFHKELGKIMWEYVGDGKK